MFNFFLETTEESSLKGVKKPTTTTTVAKKLPKNKSGNGKINGILK